MKIIRKRPVPKSAKKSVRRLLRRKAASTVAMLKRSREGVSAGRSDERYRLLVAASAQIVWMTNGEGKVTEDLPTWRKFTGQRREDLRGRGWMSVVHPEDLQGMAQRWQQALRAKSMLRDEFRVLHRDGSYRQLQSIAVPIMDAQGGVREWIGTCRDITEERKAIADQMKLAAIVSSSDDAIVGKTLTGIVQSWNKGAERIFGYTAQEMIGRHISTIIPEDRRQDLRILKSIAAGVPLEHFETERIRKDGKRIHVSLTASPIKDRQGNIVGVSKIARDITEQKMREQSLEFLAKAGEVLSASLDYEQTLRTIANLVVSRLAEWCTIHMLEEDGTIRQLALAHRDPKMIALAAKLNRRFPPDHSPESNTAKRIREGKPLLIKQITDEMLVQSARDAEHLALSRSLQFSSYMGVPLMVGQRGIGMLSLFAKPNQSYTETDLAFAQTLADRAASAVENARLYGDMEKKVVERTGELLKAQERDRTNLKRLKDMIDHLPMAAMATDESNVILQTNALFCELFALGTPESLLNKNATTFGSRILAAIEDGESYVTRMKLLMKKKEPFTALEIRLKDGRILLRDYLPVYDPNGEYRGQLSLYRDVTQERRIDATKSEFMSLASHQLRTPLTAIRWSFGRLRKNLSGQIGEFEEQLLEDGRAATSRMSATIDTMLQISRLQAGQVRLNRSRLDVNELLEEITALHANQWEEKEQDVAIEIDRSSWVVSDPLLLKEILMNILSNAIKYTPKKGTIRLFTNRDANTITINVQDSGYGIPQHQQSRVFHKFFRGENVVARDTEGTGLGLYLVSLITELLGGDIGFESAEGRGTTFRLRLPATERSDG